MKKKQSMILYYSLLDIILLLLACSLAGNYILANILKENISMIDRISLYKIAVDDLNELIDMNNRLMIVDDSNMSNSNKPSSINYFSGAHVEAEENTNTLNVIFRRVVSDLSAKQEARTVAMTKIHTLHKVGAWETDIKIIKDKLEKLYVILYVTQKSNFYNAIDDIRASIKKMRELMQKPPIIELTETQGYYFSSASVVVGNSFKLDLQEKIIPQILLAIKQYKINQVEVIGHTDEVPINSVISNLDDVLVDFLNGKQVEILRVVDNVGLGMARAAVVARMLIEDGRLDGISIVPYSAGQLVTCEGMLTLFQNIYDPQRERRRIEIRLKRIAPSLDGYSRF